MTATLTEIVAAYVEAYNARNREAAAACFSEDALVHDEGKDHRGQKEIREWTRETIEKYQPVLTPWKGEGSDRKAVVAMTVSGNFPGSPVTLSFHFTIENGRIAELSIVP
jgi:ketosteroid isomerase-like protein